ncbi:oxygenase MpaB family protein [Ketobacter sp.]|uniref:oxygenase MpaB family protein n=1 Tax=Ketobacter sp. TaxID=2083498 RepID=UPI000F215EA7|nr:oxygenase MpaB family protein [Ketobacter sp.]RLT96325.1 MAG: DUF2236 domain-containing protein [Ketobacter sp.]
MHSAQYYLSTRPTPTRVPPFPQGGIPPFIYSLIPRQVPTWLMETLLGGPVRLDPALREEMVQGLWEGDAPMDHLVDWMFEIGPGQAKKQFDQALEHGIDTVADAPQPLREFFALIDEPPPWLDRSELRKGARAVNASGAAIHYLARDFFLMGAYLLSGFNEPLIMTGALRKGTGKRFAETQSWTIDLYSPNGMERFGAGFKSTLRVRLIHALVRRNLQTKSEWDFARLGIPINQTDMLTTILTTLLLGLGSRALGVPMTRRETDAIAHHGRYAAWLMGIKEPWLFDSTAQGIRLLMHSASTQPRGEETSRIMAQSLAAEPLTREYPHFQTLRRRFEHSKHLSISRLYLSKKTLDKLGVPSNVLPWYPLLTIGPRLAWQSAHRLVPGGYRRLAEQGYRKQRNMLAVFHAGARSAAGLIQPDADHPAHI